MNVAASDKSHAESPALDLDTEGYLRELGDWNEDVAARLAAAESIALSAAHWEIIYLLRKFYAEHTLSLSMRPLVKLVARELGPDKGRSIYLLKLFPGNPALLASKIAGLPRPENCL
jgi:tRNA 2-thiouridine synthesizing protein E